MSLLQRNVKDARQIFGLYYSGRKPLFAAAYTLLRGDYKNSSEMPFHESKVAHLLMLNMAPMDFYICVDAIEKKLAQPQSRWAAFA